MLLLAYKKAKILIEVINMTNDEKNAANAGSINR